MNNASIPTFADVADAARQIEGHAVRTPLLRFTDLDRRTGATVVIKPETLQITGTFKFRGAYNRLSRLNERERAAGVVAWSSGNHAQGVAAAARTLGIAATIVMPADAPVMKMENTRRLGAAIRPYDRYTESRETIARAMVAESGSTLVPSYDDPWIIAGQGTAGLELAQQATEAIGNVPDIVLVPCGGGGLVAGCALALREMRGNCAVYSVEPRSFDDTARSLVAKHPLSIAAGATTLCDALMAPHPGELTFPINQRLLAGGLAVNDDMVLDAIAYAWRVMKLVVEPGGAVALAALLHGLIDVRGRSVGAVLSGGNVDADIYVRALARPEF